MLKLELKLIAFAISLSLLILLPIVDALLMPFFHKSGIALQFVDLNSAHLLLSHGGHLHILRVSSSRKCSLALLLLLELGQVRLHIECLLRLVQGVDARLEELVLDLVILFLRIGNLLGWLVVPEFASFCEDGDVCCGVDLLQTHLELVEKAQGNATLSLHDLVHHFGVKLDV